jgi:hypothetical protein
MAKLKLTLESLEIDTFDLGATSDGIGTVHGAEVPDPEHKHTGDSYDGCQGDPGGSGWIGCVSVYPCVPTNEWSCQITCAGYTCDSFSCPKYNTCNYAGCQIA